MAATLALTSGPANIGEGMKIATYDIVLDTTQATGGEALDFTNEFTNIAAIIPAGNDTAADNAYKYSFLCPDYATAATSSNCLVQMHWSPTGTSGEPFVEFTGNASTVGNLKCVVIGK